jgi:hypothetical protein
MSAAGPLRENYAATIQHWSTINQNRWSLLKNCLISASIIVLAWVQLASVAPNVPFDARIGLLAISILGLVQSLAWICPASLPPGTAIRRHLIRAQLEDWRAAAAGEVELPGPCNS